MLSVGMGWEMPIQGVPFSCDTATGSEGCGRWRLSSQSCGHPSSYCLGSRLTPGPYNSVLTGLPASHSWPSLIHPPQTQPQHSLRPPF